MILISFRSRLMSYGLPFVDSEFFFPTPILPHRVSLVCRDFKVKKVSLVSRDEEALTVSLAKREFRVS